MSASVSGRWSGWVAAHSGVDREPSDTSALILRVQLPPALEVFRQAHHAAGREGLPAHATLLYPFLRPEDLSGHETALLRSVVAAHATLRVRLSGPASWPDALFARVEPEGPIRALQDDLQRLYPDLPIYGGAFPFVPHVTIADGEPARSPDLASHDAWSALPVEVEADTVDLIARDEHGWRHHRRFRLGSARRPPR